MPVHNQEIAGVLEKMADLLEIEGANPFRVRAYRNAAFTVESEARSISDMIEEGDDLTELPGIGKDLAAKISEIARTGKLHQLEELEEKLPEDLSTLMGIGGLGPKRIHILHEELGISTVDELKQAAERGEIQRLKGFGRKTEKKILEEIASKATEEKRIKFIVADEIARSILSYLKGSRDVRQAVVAGSYRPRRRRSVISMSS